MELARAQRRLFLAHHEASHGVVAQALGYALELVTIATRWLTAAGVFSRQKIGTLWAEATRLCTLTRAARSSMAVRLLLGDWKPG